jgi:hypothetical protein
MILRYECDGCMVDVASAPGIPESAIITIKNQADKIKAHFQCAVRTANETTQLRGGGIGKYIGSVDVVYMPMCHYSSVHND